MRAAAENCKKALKLPTFGNLQSFKVIEVDTTKKLVTGACYDTQHVGNHFHARQATSGK